MHTIAPFKCFERENAWLIANPEKIHNESKYWVIAEYTHVLSTDVLTLSSQLIEE